MSHTKKLFVLSLLAIPILALAGDLALAGKPGNPPLPNVRYRIKYVDLPGEYMGFWINEMNNQGCVVGYYDSADIGLRHAFIYDPTVNPSAATDLHALVLPSVPDGTTIQSAAGISDRNVVVGYIRNAAGNSQGFAIDLGTENPVVDLLPTFGSTSSLGVRVNENGDILVAYRDAAGTWASFLFNPGIYNGDPVARATRNGIPLDFTGIDAMDDRVVPLPLSGDSLYFQLNNPTSGRAAQVAGKSASGVAFRYTVGSSLQLFPEARVVSQLTAVTDDGTFCGPAYFKNDVDPFRCAGAVERLATAENNPYPGGMNDSRDVLTNRQVYRDDWGGWVALDNLVVGSTTDLARWSGAFPTRFHITNRIAAANAGIIAGRRDGLVILMPEIVK